MGTIYQKILSGNANGYDKCVVLENREALLYPMADEIKDWNELRIGLTLSLTSSTGGGLNELLPPSTDTITNTSKYTSFYLGLKSNNELMPNSPGCSFIGFGHPTGNSITHIVNQTTWAPYFDFSTTAKLSYLMMSGDNNLFTTGFGTQQLPNTPTNFAFFTTPNQMYSSGTPLCMTCIRLLRVSGNGINIKVKRSVETVTSIVNTNDNSISGLRRFMGVFPAVSTYQNMQTINNPEYVVPFTSNLTMSGTPIPAPDALFLYWPFVQSKLRVHNFCIEKYS